MNVEAVNLSGGTQTQLSKAADQVVESRRKVVDLVPSGAVEEKQVQSEELLQQIKSLTEDGLYSVRFENDDRAGVVVKIVDRDSDEIIRQVPAEEILQLKAALEDLRGNIINTEG